VAAAAALVFLAAAPLTAAGLAAAELFGLNKSPSENLAGDGEALVPVSAFLRPRLAFGEDAGAAAGEADAAVSSGYAVVSAFLCVRCLAGTPAGDSPGAGD
jgi:hypothetical protein